MYTAAQPTVAIRSHNTSSKVLRILSFLLGAPIFLFGALATYIAVDQMLNPPVQGKQHALAVHIICIGIMAIPVVLGGFLLKLALLPKKRKQPVSVPPAPEGSPRGRQVTSHAPGKVVPVTPEDRAEPMAQVVEPHAVKVADPKVAAAPVRAAGTVASGQLVAACGPKTAGKTHYIVIGLLMLVLGGVAMAIPEKILEPKPGDEQMIRMVGLCGGGLIALFGVVMAVGPLIAPAQRILLYDDKLVEEKGNKTREITFEQIVGLHIQEWYEHRFAPQTYNVKVRLLGQEDVAFSSALVGDSDTIIRVLAEKSPDTQVAEFGELAC